MYGDFSVAINMSGLNARLFPAPFPLVDSLQGAPARVRTKTLQGASALARKSLVAPWPVAGVLEKTVP
jgi:hypothetical protein